MRLSNESLANLLDNVAQAIIAVDQEHRIVYFNKAAEEIFGYPAQETIGQLVDLLVPERFVETHRQHILEFITTPQAVALTKKRPGLVAKRQDGTEFPVEIGITKIAAADGEFYAALIEDITERTRAEEEIRQYAKHLELLNEASLFLNQALDLPVLIETLLPIVNRVVQADRADYYRFDPQRQILALESGAGYNDSLPLDSLRTMAFAVGEERGLAGWVAKERAPLYLADVQSDPRWIPFDHSIRSALWVPVEHKGELRGVLTVKSMRLNGLTPSDQHLVKLLANQLAVAIENARLYNEVQHRLVELETVNRVSASLRAAQTLDEILHGLLKETLTVLDATAGTIWLYDPANDELRQAAELGFPHLPVPIKPAAGIAGHVFRTGESYVSAEFKFDPLTEESTRAQVPSGLAGAWVLPLDAVDNSTIRQRLANLDEATI